MKKNKPFVIAMCICAMTLICCKQQKENSQGEGFLDQVDQVTSTVDDSALLGFFNNEKKAISPAFVSLEQGSTRPRAWIREMMVNDLDKGMVGALDDLYPGIKKDDLYHTARRAGLEDVPEMGNLVLTGEAWEKSIMWWNAETAGNWWDGFVRHAFLTKNPEAIKRARKIVENLLASQDEDGYIGIYKPSLRYQHDGSNGELWAQTTAFRTLLGYYELTSDQGVLDAVERGMSRTMEHYGPEGKNPFNLKNAFGGVTHGLMLTDVCEVLYRISGKEIYQDYATYLYQAFSTYNINRAFNDLRYPFLLDRDSLFTGHGVHTYEHFRSLVNAYYHTGYPELKTAFENALYKLDKVILPSGAGHGNEWLLALEADPTFTTTEYCTMLELRNSLSSMFQKTGNVRFADMAEKLTYNGLMGFRNSGGTALTYGKGDNCYVLDSKHHGETESHKDVRYKYSPTHSDPAVCCVPNYARNLPYFLDQMWLKAEDGLLVAMYGPSELKTSINKISVSIAQLTNYPFSDKIVFEIKPDQPITFALYFRKPGWTKHMSISSAGASQLEQNGMIRLEKEWKAGDQVRISFDQEVQTQQLTNGHVYFQRGALVFAYSIPHIEEVIRKYDGTDFVDYHCFPKNGDHQPISLVSPNEVSFEYREMEAEINPWHHRHLPKLKVDDKELIPMGSTVLRQVSFAIE